MKDIHDAELGISWGTVADVVKGMSPNHAEERLPSPGEIGEGDGSNSPSPERSKGRRK